MGIAGVFKIKSQHQQPDSNQLTDDAKEILQNFKGFAWDGVRVNPTNVRALC